MKIRFFKIIIFFCLILYACFKEKVSHKKMYSKLFRLSSQKHGWRLRVAVLLGRHDISWYPIQWAIEVIRKAKEDEEIPADIYAT